MGLITVQMTIANPRRPDIQPVNADALVDTVSVYLVIPEHVRLQLQFDEQDKKKVTLADGSGRLIPYVGAIEIRFKNRVSYVGAVVMGDEVLLGTIPIEDMDLVETNVTNGTKECYFESNGVADTRGRRNA